MSTHPCGVDRVTIRVICAERVFPAGIGRPQMIRVSTVPEPRLSTPS